MRISRIIEAIAWSTAGFVVCYSILLPPHTIHSVASSTAHRPLRAPISVPLPSKVTAPAKWLIYNVGRGNRGQGMGNLLNGLWVAHIFARRFHRTVCVNWPQFNAAFTQHPRCASILAEFSNSDRVPHVQSWNFGPTNTYKQLNATIGGPDSVIKFDGNDWPEPVWPTEPMHSLFFDNYEPSAALRPLLPPLCNTELGLHNKNCGHNRVMHLRLGDGARDKRGIFLCSNALQRIRAAFNINNYVILADHDAIYEELGLQKQGPAFHTAGLASWADWVAILTARNAVYHTPSGFSESAIRVSRYREIEKLQTGRLTAECSTEGITIEAESFDKVPWTRVVNENAAMPLTQSQQKLPGSI